MREGCDSQSSVVHGGATWIFRGGKDNHCIGCAGMLFRTILDLRLATVQGIRSKNDDRSFSWAVLQFGSVWDESVSYCKVMALSYTQKTRNYEAKRRHLFKSLDNYPSQSDDTPAI